MTTPKKASMKKAARAQRPARTMGQAIVFKLRELMTYDPVGFLQFAAAMEEPEVYTIPVRIIQKGVNLGIIKGMPTIRAPGMFLGDLEINDLVQMVALRCIQGEGNDLRIEDWPEKEQ
ncbi:MAG: hypothetical protein Greene041619_58 [Candidatus Peregrinibacteria bacterium Greene0416_19]|nr:MAG: hypothetical protein Greene041619_58 [Candidatus Peregrinibacteria bacterium Greene0416_19]